MSQVLQQHADDGDSGRSKSGRTPLAKEAVEATAALLRVIADPTRIRLMEMLDETPASVSTLTARLRARQQTVSWHLGVLHQAGIVSRRKRGAWVEYELVDWTGWWLVKQVAVAAASQVHERRARGQGPRGR